MKFAQILLLALLCSTLIPAWPGALRAQEPDRFEISDFPAYSPPYKDAAHTDMGIAQPEIRYATGGATRRPSDSEEFLSQSYRIYRKAGYAIPPLTPRITYSQTGDRVYRAFQFDFTANSLGASTAGMLMEEYDCGTVPDGVNPADFRNWIALDNSIDGKQTYVRMHVLSHEMLHAFQFAHPLFYRDCPPGWIQEGLADAAANFITEQRFPAAWKRQKRADMSSWRSYRVAFQDDQDWLDDPHYEEVVVPLLARFSGGNSSANLDAAEAMGYHTSGFWQFLARRSTGKKPGGASVDDVSSLLATWYPMLQTTTNGRVGRSTGWLNLVNDFVAAHVNLEEKQADNALYAWLPEFFTEYATWWEVRNPA